MKRIFTSPLILMTLVIAITALYLGLRIDRGWIPQDEGFVAGAPARVLLGEWPHRDFADVYTGGLTFLHAAAFRLFGVHLLSARVTLLLFSLFFMAAFYLIATRWVPPAVAALVSVVALVWSLANYFAALPSWYVIFCSVIGTWAFVNFLETDRKKWLFATGCCAGLAFLLKAHGLTIVGGVLLSLVYREQQTARDSAERGRDWTYSIFCIVSLLAFASSLGALVARRTTGGDVFYFVVPGLTLALFLVAGELRLERRGRWRALLEPIFAFACGMALPITLFLLPYAATGSLGDLFHGVFILPQKRFSFIEFPPPKLIALIAAIPILLLLSVPVWSRKIRFNTPIKIVLWAAALFLLGLGVVHGGRPDVYTAVWLSARPLSTIAVVVGILVLATSTELPSPERQRLFLMLAMCSMLSLIQFPYAHGIYFCYVAPWVLLAMTALVSRQHGAPRNAFLAVLVFYGLFAAAWPNHGEVRRIGFRHTPVAYNTEMGIERGGLRITRFDAIRYHRLVSLIQEHSDDDAYIYAAPDCPEVYFLSARRNPTRTFYDIFDEDFVADPAARLERILSLLERRDVDVVVFNKHPEFSSGVQPDLAAELRRRYPQYENLPAFTVHWREPSE